MRVGTASSYVRAEDPALLTGLVEDPSLRQLGLFRIAPTVLAALVPAAALQAALRDRGLASTVEGPDGRVVRTERHRTTVRSRVVGDARSTPPPGALRRRAGQTGGRRHRSGRRCPARAVCRARPAAAGSRHRGARRARCVVDARCRARLRTARNNGTPPRWDFCATRSRRASWWCSRPSIPPDSPSGAAYVRSSWRAGACARSTRRATPS
ncbi:hypothetical protein NKG05_18775 [Oerskovia sp. M15]